MDLFFFVGGVVACAVAALFFYIFGRRNVANGQKYESTIRWVFIHTVLLLLFFTECAVLSFFSGMKLSEESGGIVVIGLLFLLDLAPLLYLRRVRYALFISGHFKWILTSVIAVAFGSMTLGCTTLQHPVYIFQCWIFLAYNAYLCCMAILAQCRLACRFGRENMSGHLVRSTAVISILFLVLVIFSVLLIAGGDRKISISVMTASVLLQIFHSHQVLKCYPVIRWIEKKCVIDVKSEDAAYMMQDAVGASESLSVRLADYFIMEKPYLSPDLNIKEVALYLMTNKTTLSRVIHNNLNTNFREYVNRHRVQEAMSLYSKNMHLDMEQLARLCGFRNNSSFTNAFKLNIGKTPGAWCKDFKEKRNEIWKKEYLESSERSVETKEAFKE